VRVKNIEPKQKGGQVSVKMTISADNEEAKLRFLNVLEQSETFSHLQLSSVHPDTGDAADAGRLILELTFIYARA
jgi:hypothetical protein